MRNGGDSDSSEKAAALSLSSCGSEDLSGLECGSRPLCPTASGSVQPPKRCLPPALTSLG